MSQSKYDRRALLLSLFAVTAATGTVATAVTSANAAPSVCEIGNGRHCWKWKLPPLTPRPDKPNTKQK